jgi:hypothetical protein
MTAAPAFTTSPGCKTSSFETIMREVYHDIIAIQRRRRACPVEDARKRADVPATPDFKAQCHDNRGGRDISAFTRVFDAPCPATTALRNCST